jgi:hypothetical protein
LNARTEEITMPFRRGGFALTPPTLALFIISLVLAIIAFLIRYGGIRIPIINPAYIFELLAIAYVMLVLGVLIRRL